MRDYVLRRLLLVPLTFVGITFVAFCFTRFVPGGPIEQALAERQQADRKRSSAARPSGPASPEELDNLKRRYGFDRPLTKAYAIWLGIMPGPADWTTVRLGKDGKAEAEVADELHAGQSFKLEIKLSGKSFAVTTLDGKPRDPWRAEPAPFPMTRTPPPASSSIAKLTRDCFKANLETPPAATNPYGMKSNPAYRFRLGSVAGPCFWPMLSPYP